MAFFICLKLSEFLRLESFQKDIMGSNKQRFEGGLPYYHRQGDGKGDGGAKALDWKERKKQIDRNRRRRIWLLVGSLVAVLGLVTTTFLLMAQ